MYNNASSTFPKQKVSESQKSNKKWIKDCTDYIISCALSNGSSRSDIQSLFDFLKGNISQEDYKKILNPYNSHKEQFKRFPATLRNLDITSDVVRRYVGEYIKAPHLFVVTATNPEIVMRKEAKIKELIMEEASRRFAVEFEQLVNSKINEGADAETANQSASEEMDFAQYAEQISKEHVDDISKQAEDIIKVLDNYTNADNEMATAFFNFIVSGEVYTYRTISKGQFVKEVVSPTEMFPITNGSEFIEDCDMCARKRMMSYNQILDTFTGVLTKAEEDLLYKLYVSNDTAGAWSSYSTLYSDIYNISDSRDLFNKSFSPSRNDLIEVWHVVWKSYLKYGILTYVNEVGLIDTMLVEEGFKFDETLGHINIEWDWKLQTREATRIGDTSTGLYIDAKPILVDRNGKLPYNGVCELIPNMGKFSIVGIMRPFQIMRNIFAYTREMAIAKAKLLTLVLPASLLGSNPDMQERTLYRMAADGVMIYDDSSDSNSIKAQQIRILQGNMGSYITELTNLMESIKAEARELVDMTPQRYGAITNSAGKGVTQEAIARGSMGSVLVFFKFDKFRELDYQADLDYTKVAWADGFDYSFFDENYEINNFHLNVDNHTFADYIIRVKNSANEQEKLGNLRDIVLAAAQNGQLDMAAEALDSRSVSGLKSVVARFQELQRQHEKDLKQLDAEINSKEIADKIQLIDAQKEADMELLELKYNYEMAMNGMKQDIDTNNNRMSDDIESKRLDFERQKLSMDNNNKALDRNLKAKELNIKSKKPQK